MHLAMRLGTKNKHQITSYARYKHVFVKVQLSIQPIGSAYFISKLKAFFPCALQTVQLKFSEITL